MSEGDVPRAAPPRCPTCGQPATWHGNSARPFCSIRCKLIDLGGWLDEAYRIASPASDPPPPRDSHHRDDTA